ncbi:MAG: gamma-glutamyltransferase family protein [Desulfocapsaceae bacterium]|jgi:gamma-glutamyltranspeptidase/glutathione hydrolase|nr:gamma-glutamyltransferase family protein [Desulfocapsaceae bacterium]
MNRWSLPYSSRRPIVMASNIVSTSQPLASQAGLQMLMAGGNAVDAVLAAAITLTVVEPTGNGIGSDAFAQVWDTKELHGINGSGCSPASWSLERFAHLDEMPKHGWDSVTVPGAVSVWADLSRRFGRLPFEQLFEPAVGYARGGFQVSPIIAEKWQRAAENLREYEEFSRVFLPGGTAPAAGSTFSCPEAASTLEEIARTSGESLYRGDLAALIAGASKEQGGSLSSADLAAHRSEWTRPVQQRYRDVDVLELPPNGQGIAALIALGILDQFELKQYPPDSADSVHLQVEAMKLAFSDVFCHLADSEAMKIDYREMLDPHYLRRRAEAIDMSRPGQPLTGIPEGSGTVYLAAADGEGMMVSFIQSNFHGFGSGIVVPGTGISLNNRGYGFKTEAAHPNCVAGGKKPFHTIIPGFVMKGAEPLLAFGVMGGHMQAQGHVQMVTRIFDYGQNLQAASDAPRWQVLQDSRLALENCFPKTVMSELRERGHQVVAEDAEFFGGAQLIFRSGNHYSAGSDHRKDGQAVGY